jgi:hypothetical protein
VPEDIIEEASPIVSVVATDATPVSCEPKEVKLPVLSDVIEAPISIVETPPLIG